MNKTKPKKNKRRCNYEKTTHTLDVCHEKKLEDFNKDYNGLSKLQKELKSVRKHIKKLEFENRESISDTSSEEDDIDNSIILNELHEYKTKENKIQNSINKLTSKKEEIDYLIKTSDILFNYYDSIENNNESGNNPNVKKIIDFFNPNKMEEDIPKKTSSDENHDRSELLESYLSTTDKNYINNYLKKVEQKCNFCNSTNINELLNDGILYCTECHSIEFIQTDNERPSYRDPPKEISYFSYNRINHFDIGVKQEALKVCNFLVLIY
jgi:hypothetical protein|tara:strand:- start:909 stop:1709 length:801 start_codon:yes stop_codon:yes gene_type:complete